MLGISVIEGKPLRPSAPQQKQGLTMSEQVCEILGNYAYASTKAREAGMSYLQVVKLRRQQIRATSSPFQESLNAAILATMRLAYLRPALTPAIARQDTELDCLTIVEQTEK